MDEIAHVDGWDRHDRDKYRQPMPPMTLAEALSGEPRSLYVAADGDGDGRTWSLTRGEGDVPSGPYSDLADAKRVGDAFLDKAHAASGPAVTADAGLDVDEWFLSSDRSPVEFTRNAEPTQVISRHATAGTWLLVVGDEEVGAFETPASAASAAPVPAASALGA